MPIGTINIGDLKVRDDGHLGFSIQSGKGRRVWFNELGIDALLEWIKKKRIYSYAHQTRTIEARMVSDD